jgi:hypothetical protein
VSQSDIRGQTDGETSVTGDMEEACLAVQVLLELENSTLDAADTSSCGTS